MAEQSAAERASERRKRVLERQKDRMAFAAGAVDAYAPASSPVERAAEGGSVRASADDPPVGGAPLLEELRPGDNDAQEVEAPPQLSPESLYRPANSASVPTAAPELETLDPAPELRRRRAGGAGAAPPSEPSVSHAASGQVSRAARGAPGRGFGGVSVARSLRPVRLLMCALLPVLLVMFRLWQPSSQAMSGVQVFVLLEFAVLLPWLLDAHFVRRIGALAVVLEAAKQGRAFYRDLQIFFFVFFLGERIRQFLVVR